MNSAEFSHNFNQIQHKLFLFAVKLTRDENRAKDLVQETAFKAFKNLSRFKPGTNFKAWLSTILRNTFINDYRKKKRRNLHEESVDDIIYRVDQSQYTYNEGTVNLEVSKIKSFIRQLKPKYEVPFMMFYRGYGYAEIADHLDIPLGTVKSRIFSARNQLKTSIGSAYTLAS
jgi:RNA polymerase sigma factor (sigma-70 family)